MLVRTVGLLVLLVLASSATAFAQDWRYRVRPGDTLWDLGRAHLRADVPWQQLQSLNRIEDPWQLPPGTELRFPVAWLRIQPVKARVVALHGEAFTHPADASGRLAPVRAEMQLGAGTVIRTAADANLTLAFADGSRLQLHGDSELRLDRLSAWGATGMVDTRLRLIRGRSTNSAARARGPASRFVVDTPGTMATVRGTRFRIGHEPGRTLSEVLEGAVQVAGGGRSRTLRDGQGTASGADSRPLPPVPLLPSPDLAAWPDRLERLPAVLEWPPVDGAQAYRLQVAPDPEFLSLVVDTVTRTPDIALSVPDDGIFHARLRAIDAHGLEGQDALASMHVAARPVAPFAISPAPDAATPGPRPRFRWTRSEGSAGYRVQVARSGDFAEPLLDLDNLRREELRAALEFDPGDYVWRIGAIDDAGQHGPWSDAVPFVVTPPEAGPEIGDDGVVRSRRGLEVAWPAGNAGQRHRFQLSRDSGFTRIELEELLDDSRIVLSDLRSGTWYMRTQLVDSDGYAHPFGPVQSAKIGCLACRIAIGAGLLLLVL